MKPRLIKVLRWVAYPAFYLVCLGIFGYLTFPFDRLRERIIVEFEKQQRAQGSAQHLSIEHLGSYWFSGVAVEGVKLTLPADDAASKSDEPAKEAVIAIDAAHMRVRLLPLLLGRVRIDFWANAFGGEVSGTVPYGRTTGALELNIDAVDLAKVSMLTDALGLPLRGVASGHLELAMPEMKTAKAEGSMDFTIQDLAVGDGKTKIKGQLALPEAKLGSLTLSAEAKDGVLKVSKGSAPGPDLELAIGDAKVSLRDPWADSMLDIYAKFRFSDAYRGKNDITKSLLGAPGSSAPALLDLADPKVKKAKRPDGFYGWHIYGPLKHLKFDPAATSATDAAAPKATKPLPFAAPALKLPAGQAPSPPSLPSLPSRGPEERPVVAPPPPPAPVAAPPERPSVPQLPPPPRGAPPPVVADQPAAEPAPLPPPPEEQPDQPEAPPPQ